MAITPITRKENFLARAAGENGLELEPVTREEYYLNKIAEGGGGSVTPASIVTATGQMTAQQKADTRANIGATDASTSIPDNVKQALLACFADVAWADDQGQAHYDALEAALYPLDHITAVYTQSGTVYDTDSLDSLKTDLVVTAFYESGNTETVPAANYTLSGTLTVGTSTITVSYGGKTATFDVTVTTAVLYSLENYAFNTENIKTGVLLFETDHNWSIAYDITLTTSPTSGNSSTHTLVIINDAEGSAYASLSLQKNSGVYLLRYMGTNTLQTLSASTGRYRFVITHAVGSGKIDMKIRKDNNSAVEYSVDGAFVATPRQLGLGTGTGVNSLPQGTLNNVKVYSTVLSSAQIEEFLGLGGA